jgi:hypothetical protein
VTAPKGKYSIELFKKGGEGADLQEILYRHDSLAVARSIYRASVERYSGRLIMLCDRARVLARGDPPVGSEIRLLRPQASPH